MPPNTDRPRHVPWVAIALGVLALVSVLFSLDVGSAGYAGDWFSMLMPIIIFASIVAFFWGLTRIFSKNFFLQLLRVGKKTRKAPEKNNYRSKDDEWQEH